MNKYYYYKNCFSILIFLYSSISFSQSAIDSPVPQNSRQMLLVLTDSITSTNGNLIYFKREKDQIVWEQISDTFPVVIGRNGLGWGRGLNSIDSLKLPMKTEGDGRSPAGVFELGAAFGYTNAKEMKGLKIPYVPVTEMVECIDDINSSHYNKIVLRSEIEELDWLSSEKMYFAGVWYEQGVIVKQNMDPIIPGAGSCIFLHNWSAPNETTAGCTEMEPLKMKELIYWLDSSTNPVLVQLTKQLYNEYQQSWELPIIDKSN
jgi:zinc D-Ala-D-Ala dipeptidase